MGPRCRISRSICSRTDTQVEERGAASRVSMAEGSTICQKFACLDRRSHRASFGVEGALSRRHGQIEDAGRVNHPEQQAKNIRYEDTGENQHESYRGKQKREQTSPVLHLQDAIARDHLHNRKHDDAKASQMAESMQNILDGIAFGG